MGLMLAMTFVALPVQANLKHSNVRAYALVIGSNNPGKNQQPLRYAHDDARRMVQVLTEVGIYPDLRLKTLIDPKLRHLHTALNEISEQIKTHQRRDENTTFLFYYSGHARAHALNLGQEEFRLEALRYFLEKLPAKLKVVILDACQTGAFSQVKGLQAAKDFSYNSVNMLQTEGMAVIASSTGSELSQESDDLGGSVFTHHLVAGLRGAADSDSDGRITLFEAYRYTYNQTLVATAGTYVGRQHVTLETNLVGKGELVLAWPEKGSSALDLPEPLESEILVYRTDNQAIVAEVHKVGGSSIRLALAPGKYTVLVRSDRSVSSCLVTLDENHSVALDLTDCQLLDSNPAPKGSLADYLGQVPKDVSQTRHSPSMPATTQSTPDRSSTAKDRQGRVSIGQSQLSASANIHPGRVPIIIATGVAVLGLIIGSISWGIYAYYNSLEQYYGEKLSANNLAGMTWQDTCSNSSLDNDMETYFCNTELKRRKIGESRHRSFIIGISSSAALVAGGVFALVFYKNPDLFSHKDKQAKYALRPYLGAKSVGLVFTNRF